MIVTSAQSPAPTAAATSPAMKPIGRFSPTSTGRAGFGGVTVRGAAAVRGDTGRVNEFGAAGGRLNGLTAGCSLIEPSYEKGTRRLQAESSPHLSFRGDG